MDYWIQLFGRLHPLVIHFPVVSIILAAGLETARRFWDPPGIGRFVTFLVVVATVGALAAVATGWVFAHESTRADHQLRLSWHRWLGMTTAAVNCLALAMLLLFSESSDPGLKRLRLAILWGASGVLAATAHIGALLVWGDDYFSSDR